MKRFLLSDNLLPSYGVDIVEICPKLMFCCCLLMLHFSRSLQGGSEWLQNVTFMKGYFVEFCPSGTTGEVL